MIYWLWAYREFGWSQAQVDDQPLADFLDLYVLTDKINNPDEYLPGEYYFHA